MSENTYQSKEQLRKLRARTAARLAHDVGKYLTRTARNLPGGAVPDALIPLLTKDLYATDGKRSASQVFEVLGRPLLEAPFDTRLDTCRARLAQIDALETSVRRVEQPALRRAAQLALEVATLLDAVAKDLNEAEP